MAEIKDWDCALALSIHLRMFSVVICPECLKVGPEGIRATFRKRAEKSEAMAELIRNAKDESEILKGTEWEEIENPLQFFEESAAMLRLNENEEWIIPSHDEWEEHTLKLERDERAERAEQQRKLGSLTEFERRQIEKAELAEFF